MPPVLPGKIAARALRRLPPRTIQRLVGAPRHNDRGDRLDPHTQAIIRVEPLFRGDHSTPAALRLAMARSMLTVEGSQRAVGGVRDTHVGGVPARVYTPAHTRAGGPAPTLIYAHGGGWVCGDLRTHDRLCRRLCADSHRVVVAVHYRLAPEHPYPAGLDDLLSVLRRVLSDPGTVGGGGPVTVGGDSAGGNLSAAACLKLRDAGEPLPERQLLIYPGLDLRCCSASYRALSRGYLLDADDIETYIQSYGAPDITAPLASPVLASDLSGLPPAIITTAGFDPLRDDGEAYATRLQEAGVGVLHLAEPTLTHGYANMDGAVPEANRAISRICEALRTPHGPPRRRQSPDRSGPQR